MLAVHWTPVSNTKHILKRGIATGKKGVYCFPLTGHKSLDQWWIYFFNQCGARQRKRYNGIVFRIGQEDMPAYFGHWIGATSKSEFKKEIRDVKALGREFRNIIMLRLGEEIAYGSEFNRALNDSPASDGAVDYRSLADKAVAADSRLYSRLLSSLDNMTYAFEDYQIVLSNAISPDRILKVLPQGNEFGKVLRLQKSRRNGRFDRLDKD